MRNRKAQGFTLIELLIVIAIIGILAAVLIPNLMNARITAQMRAAQAHSNTLYTAAMAALADDIEAEASDVSIADCNAGGAILVDGLASAYSANAAPAGSTCTLGDDGAGDIEASVTHTSSGTEYINGVEQ